jgi:hypothetical protein
MSKYLKLYIMFIGLIGLLASCEKDEVRVIMSDNPIPPSITSMPDLTLQRSNGNDTLVFTGTAVDPGFQASANYYLEACASGTDFADPIELVSSTKADQLKITVGDLNSMLIKKFPTDQASSIDFRIRSVLVVDAGTGAPGTSTNPFAYNSDVKTADVTLYGLPRLDLIDSGMDQKIESALGDGNYTGFVKLSVDNPFTLKDPDTGTTYGADGSALAVDGSAIEIPADPGSGWYNLSANVNDLTYELNPYMIGLIGDATPNGWSAPDQKMDYDPQSGLWSITLDLEVGSVKFRLNDGWSNGINLGIGDADHPQYTLDNLWNDGSSQNIPIDEAGNYTITLSIGSSTYSATITKN